MGEGAENTNGAMISGMPTISRSLTTLDQLQSDVKKLYLEVSSSWFECCMGNLSVLGPRAVGAVGLKAVHLFWGPGQLYFGAEGRGYGLGPRAVWQLLFGGL